FYLLVLGLVVLLRQHGPQYGPEAWYLVGRWFLGLIATIAVVCGSLYYLMHKDYTVIASSNGNILVVKDKLHDAVIERLQACRVKRLRQLSAPDPANSPDEELFKLKLLLDEGAIAQDEYVELCSRVRASTN